MFRKLASSRTCQKPLAGIAASVATIGMSVSVAGASAAAALPPGCTESGPIVSCTQTFTSGSNPFTVPAGVSAIQVVAVGGMGGTGVDLFGNAVGAGGHGAVVKGDLSVSGGSTLFAVVGGNASGATAGGPDGGAGGLAFEGGGGGGGGAATDVRTSQNDLSSRLLVAGGGGGAGPPRAVAGGGGSGGAGGGHDGSGSGLAADGAGGAGGSGSAGGSGGTGGSCDLFTPAFSCSPGGAGSASGSDFGGAGGSGAVNVAVLLRPCPPPSIAIPPAVSCVGFSAGGGGGGGGLFGGGGGGGGAAATRAGFFGGAGGGGGGSNMVPAGGSQSIDTTGVPMVQISYKLVPTSKGQCKDGGWRAFPQFKNEGECVSFVETGK